MMMVRLLGRAGRGLLPLAAIRWSKVPSRRGLLGARACSILGSPACGSEPGGQGPLFQGVLAAFPGGRSLVFAYGSGVFQQAEQPAAGGNMTDFIFCVDDAEQWHRENMRRHPSHYPVLARLLGPERLAALQRDWGARLYFNTLVPWGEGRIKYGVIQREDLLADLLDWQTLYTAGRLHKPVNILERRAPDPELGEALRANLASALHTALLLLPTHFTEERLYLTLAGLSYTGDFRMVVGEDKNKVRNIVRPQLPRFRELYGGRLRDSQAFLKVREGGECEQDCSQLTRLHHLELLPVGVTDNLVLAWSRKHHTLEIPDVETVSMSLAADPDCDHRVLEALAAVVAGTDKTQAAKGILTAGPVKAARYAAAKLGKMARSLGK